MTTIMDIIQEQLSLFSIDFIDLIIECFKLPIAEAADWFLYRGIFIVSKQQMYLKYSHIANSSKKF